jgi:hypothetical protein
MGKVVWQINKNVQGKINGMELAGVVRFQVAPTVDSMKSMNGSTVMLMTQAFKSSLMMKLPKEFNKKLMNMMIMMKWERKVNLPNIS